VFAQNGCHVCPQSLFINIFGKIKEKNLYLSLRTTGKRYRKVKRLRGILSNRRLIEDRPCRFKATFGDLEIDTIIGKNHKGAIVTINDRATGILRMKKAKKVNWLNKRQLNY
jgi:IS30 family transposase